MKKMKDSRIEWVPEIPEDWDVKRIKYLMQEKKIKTNNGLEERALSVTQNKGIIRSVDATIANPSSSYEDYIEIKTGDIVFNKYKAHSGVFFVSPYDGIVTFNYSVYKCNSFANPHYYELLFKTAGCIAEFRKRLHGVGESISPLYTKDLFDIHVIVPPRKTQDEIVAFLDYKCSEIDALSSDIQSEIDTLIEYRNSVITEAVTKGLEKNALMKDSGIEWCPKIPRKWKCTNPKALFFQRLDRAHNGDRQLTASQEFGIMYQDEFMDMTGNRVVTVLKDFSILKHVEPGDFVISMRSFQGGLEYSEVRGCISSAYVMLIPNKELVYPPFYRWLFKSSKYINAIQSTSNLVRDGQAMRYANFVQVPLFIVPLDEQKMISEYLEEKVKDINSILREKKEQLQILADYKKSVIYEYVTGKKEVPNN